MTGIVERLRGILQQAKATGENPTSQRALEAALTEAADHIERLEAALRMMSCPRPCNHRPDQFDAGDCFDAGECGCVAGSALAPTQGGTTP